MKKRTSNCLLLLQTVHNIAVYLLHTEIQTYKILCSFKSTFLEMELGRGLFSLREIMVFIYCSMSGESANYLFFTSYESTT